MPLYCSFSSLWCYCQYFNYLLYFPRNKFLGWGPSLPLVIGYRAFSLPQSQSRALDTTGPTRPHSKQHYMCCFFFFKIFTLQIFFATILAVHGCFEGVPTQRLALFFYRSITDHTEWISLNYLKKYYLFCSHHFM